jgi:6,7-dimethyl-8-ribityllumazine synthase
MSSKDKITHQINIPDGVDMSLFKIGIITSSWNDNITGELHSGALNTLKSHGILAENITEIWVPGSFELPVAAKMLLSQQNSDAVICLGCVIKGETKHDEYISQSVAQGIMNLSIVSGKPITFGVLTTDNLKQAQDRAGGKYGNKGEEAAVTALQMILINQQLKTPAKKIGY